MFLIEKWQEVSPANNPSTFVHVEIYDTILYIKMVRGIITIGCTGLILSLWVLIEKEYCLTKESSFFTESMITHHTIQKYLIIKWNSKARNLIQNNRFVRQGTLWTSMDDSIGILQNIDSGCISGLYLFHLYQVCFICLLD